MQEVPMSSSRIVAAAILWLVCSISDNPVPASTHLPAPSELEEFIEEMAVKHGFDRRELKELLGRARVRSGVIRAISRLAEPVS